LVLILGIGLVAAAAQYFYNRANREHPEQAQTAVTSFRQSTGVLAAIVTFVVTLLDALAMIRKVMPQTAPAAAAAPAPPGKMFGATVAVDIAQ
jgi:hypothetical protein